MATDDGANLLAAYRRAANILRIEERKDGPHDGAADPRCCAEPAEVSLDRALMRRHGESATCCDDEAISPTAMAELAATARAAGRVLR